MTKEELKEKYHFLGRPGGRADRIGRWVKTLGAPYVIEEMSRDEQDVERLADCAAILALCGTWGVDAVLRGFGEARTAASKEMLLQALQWARSSNSARDIPERLPEWLLVLSLDEDADVRYRAYETVTEWLPEGDALWVLERAWSRENEPVNVEYLKSLTNELKEQL